MVAPPIRLSIEDDGLDREVASWIEVLLDGAIVAGVTAYDCRAGTVTMASCTCSLCRSEGAVITVERRGRVEVRWRDGTPPA